MKAVSNLNNMLAGDHLASVADVFDCVLFCAVLFSTRCLG